jgi:hypothetical protein
MMGGEEEGMSAEHTRACSEFFDHFAREAHTISSSLRMKTH